MRPLPLVLINAQVVNSSVCEILVHALTFQIDKFRRYNVEY